MKSSDSECKTNKKPVGGQLWVEQSLWVSADLTSDYATKQRLNQVTTKFTTINRSQHADDESIKWSTIKVRKRKKVLHMVSVTSTSIWFTVWEKNSKTREIRKNQHLLIFKINFLVLKFQLSLHQKIDILLTIIIQRRDDVVSWHKHRRQPTLRSDK